MATLWLFGDSFCDSQGSREPHRGWWNILSLELGYDLEVRAHSGCSSQWQLRQWLTERGNLRAEDIVIFVHTHPDRIWFYEHLPWMTSPHLLERYSLPRWSGRYHLEEILSAEAQGLVPTVRADWCERHWETDHWPQMNRDLQQLISLDVAQQPIRATVILEAFASGHQIWRQPGVVGTLFEISCREFREGTDPVAAMMQRGDPRTGHLSLVNHQRLADRIRQFVLGQSLTLDLNAGFAEHFLREQDVWTDR